MDVDWWSFDFKVSITNAFHPYNVGQDDDALLVPIYVGAISSKYVGEDRVSPKRRFDEPKFGR